MPAGQEHVTPAELPVHRIGTADFDAIANGTGDIGAMRLLREAERSRRLLLLRAITDLVAKDPAARGPLPHPDEAWDLLARVQNIAPEAVDLLLGHPYTGTWAGYTIRLLRKQITGVCPLWVHTGHLQALAAAAAIRAGLDFTATIPVWAGTAMLPGLGVARFRADTEWMVAEVRRAGAVLELDNGRQVVRAPADPAAEGPGWWGLREVTAMSGDRVLSVRLDDLDPYRGSFEPVLPQRIPAEELTRWAHLLDGAWRLIVRCLPDTADAFPVGFSSLVPRPMQPFRTTSASSGEAFGSAVISRPADAASLAASLVHEFQHNRLSGLMHLRLLHGDDPAERFYTAWRDDPRPIGGVFQGVYAFFGVTAFWRALARLEDEPFRPIAEFEFAYWRQAVWQVLDVLRADPWLTIDGRRFLRRIAEQLRPWLREPVPTPQATAASAALLDHYAGWRLRHLRPDPLVVRTLAEAWSAGRPRPALGFLPDADPTPVPDGRWHHARLDLTRLALADPAGFVRHRQDVPDATTADFAYVSGQFAQAAEGYRAELSADPDSPTAWTGLGLALSRSATGPAGSVLLHQPELVRAVHRLLAADGAAPDTPDELASWLGWLRTGTRPARS
ncbi:HEXXH motif domain-containing protein [Amycolatopsis tolypomycina]|uniref:HEXXH motif-containing protein n=1 Tax=Amycolatopsis tolypomycina TaxID=208445 RepID=A0A1H5BJX4_9PSEU|nr:HEXXH motif domain-containing protein [Amycolatopsis tolypomycina]SED54933.1 HEXXH motif-containing protein [Amycolatopsis tolypomycina]